MNEIHTIEVYDNSDGHYKYYDTDDFEIDGFTLAEHDAKIRADAIDEFIEKARKLQFASIDGREIFFERIYKIVRELKEQSNE